MYKCTYVQVYGCRSGCCGVLRRRKRRHERGSRRARQARHGEVARRQLQRLHNAHCQRPPGASPATTQTQCHKLLGITIAQIPRGFDGPHDYVKLHLKMLRDIAPSIKKYANGVAGYVGEPGIKTEGMCITLCSTVTADWLVEDVVLQLATTSGVVMQLNGIAESTCGDNTIVISYDLRRQYQIKKAKDTG